MSLSPRGRSAKNLIQDHMPPESLLAMKALNVTVDADKELPDTSIAENICAKVTVNLEERSNNPAAAKRAAEIQQYAQDILSKKYTAQEKDCEYLLKVYVVLASANSVLNKLTIGLIGEATTECLEWFLELQAENNEILKAGRVGVQKARGQIYTMTAELCESLIEKNRSQKLMGRNNQKLYEVFASSKINQNEDKLKRHVSCRRAIPTYSANQRILQLFAVL